MAAEHKETNRETIDLETLAAEIELAAGKLSQYMQEIKDLFLTTEHPSKIEVAKIQDLENKIKALPDLSAMPEQLQGKKPATEEAKLASTVAGLELIHIQVEGTRNKLIRDLEGIRNAIANKEEWWDLKYRYPIKLFVNTKQPLLKPFVHILASQKALEALKVQTIINAAKAGSDHTYILSNPEMESSILDKMRSFALPAQSKSTETTHPVAASAPTIPSGIAAALSSSMRAVTRSEVVPSTAAAPTPIR